MGIRDRLNRLERAIRPECGIGIHILHPPYTRHKPKYKKLRDETARRIRADRKAGKQIITWMTSPPEGYVDED